MKITTFSQAKGKFEEIGFNPKIAGPYAELTNSYLGDSPYLGSKEKEALTNIFIKFAALLDSLEPEQVNKYKTVNTFVQNLLCMAQIYYCVSKKKTTQSDVELFTKARMGIKVILQIYEKIEGKESDKDYQLTVSEVNRLVDDLKYSVHIETAAVTENKEKTPDFKTAKHSAGAVEATLVASFISLDRFIKFLIHEKGGIYAVIGIALLDSARFVMYCWNMSKKKEQGDRPLKIHANFLFYLFKATVSIAGVVLIYAGTTLLGFAAIILGGAVATLRHGVKALNYGYDWLIANDDFSKNKAKSNGTKALIGAMIITGFVLYTFFPELILFSILPLKDIAYGLVMAGASYILLSFISSMVAEKVNQYTKLENIADSNALDSGNTAPNAQTLMPGQGGSLHPSLHAAPSAGTSRGPITDSNNNLDNEVKRNEFNEEIKAR